MNISQIYIALAVVVFAVIAILVFVVNKNKKDSHHQPALPLDLYWQDYFLAVTD